MPRFLDPTTPLGALAIGLLFVAAGFASTWVIRRVTDETLLRDRRGHADKLAISFASHFVIFLAWIMLAGFYAHLVPVLNKLGTALLAGVSVVSIVVGFAAQTTLGNLIAGVSLVLYKPFGQGDRIQVPSLRSWRRRATDESLRCSSTDIVVALFTMPRPRQYGQSV